MMIRKLIVGMFSLVMAFTMLAGCNPEGKEGVTLNKKTLSLVLNQSETLVATVLPKSGDTEIVWSTSDDMVATVSDGGKVTAVGVGPAVIKATVNGKSASCNVVVSAAEDEKKVDGYLYYEDFTEYQNVPHYLRILENDNGVVSVEDDALLLENDGEGSAFTIYKFDEVLSGTVIAEFKIKALSNEFFNAMSFYHGLDGISDNDAIVNLGMIFGGFVNHNGTNWGSTIKTYSLDTWHVVTMVLSINNGNYDLFVDGVSVSSQTFRKIGAGASDRIRFLKIGSNAPNASVTYDYIKVCYAGAPGLTITSQANATLELSADLEYEFKYEASGTPIPKVEITCNRQSGWSFDDNNANLVKFRGAGVYTFTVKAENIVGSASKAVVITVTGSDYSPSIDVVTRSYDIALNVDDSVELGYTVTGSPSPTLTVVCVNQTSGFSVGADKKTITFTESGSYEFVVNAENDIDIAEESFFVTVKIHDNVLFETDFSVMPDDMKIVRQTGQSIAEIDNGTLSLRTGPASSSVLAQYDFGTPLSGKVMAETRFMHTSVGSSHFVNVLFLYDASAQTNETDKNTACLAIEANKLRYRDSANSAWHEIANINRNEWYDLAVLFDFEDAKMTVYLNGTRILDKGSFRNAHLKDNTRKLTIGSTDRVNNGLKYDSMRFSKYTEPSVTVISNNDQVTLSGGGDYTLDYSVFSLFESHSIDVTCDKASGFTLQNDKKSLKFTVTGTYVFTVSVTDYYGTKSQTITVNVS